MQEISFKELCIWASIVFISLFLLIPYLPPLAQTLLQDYIDKDFDADFEHCMFREHYEDQIEGNE